MAIATLTDQKYNKPISATTVCDRNMNMFNIIDKRQSHFAYQATNNLTKRSVDKHLYLFLKETLKLVIVLLKSEAGE